MLRKVVARISRRLFLFPQARGLIAFRLLAEPGSAFHLGRSRQPAKKSEKARAAKIPPQPQLACKKPGMVPPMMAQIEPQPLISPAAVEAPFFVPTSTAAVPLTSESGAYNKNPINKKAPPNIHFVAGSLSLEKRRM